MAPLNKVPMATTARVGVVAASSSSMATSRRNIINISRVCGIRLARYGHRLAYNRRVTTPLSDRVSQTRTRGGRFRPPTMISSVEDACQAWTVVIYWKHTLFRVDDCSHSFVVEGQARGSDGEVGRVILISFVTLAKKDTTWWMAYNAASCR